jgi:hypothetical protein
MSRERVADRSSVALAGPSTTHSCHRRSPVVCHARQDLSSCTDPIAGCSSGDSLSIRIDITRAGAVFQEHSDNLALFVLGRGRAGMALPRVLHREVQWSRTALVHQPRVCAIAYESADGLRA